MRCVLVVLACLSSSCFSTAQFDAQHASRVAEIDRRFEEMRDSTRDSYRPLFKQLDELRKFLIPIKSGANYSPVERVEDRIQLGALRRVCSDATKEAIAKTPEAAADFERIGQECSEKIFKDTYVPALAATYYPPVSA